MSTQPTTIHRGLQALLLLTLFWTTGAAELRAVFVEDKTPSDPLIEADGGAHPEILTLRAKIDQGVYQYCTGTVIASDRVLTAAHCLRDEDDDVFVQASDISVYIDHNADQALTHELWMLLKGQAPPDPAPPLVWTVEDVHPHPDFADPSETGADIAVLEMATPISKKYLQPFPVVPAGLLPSPHLPGVSGLDRWQALYVEIGGGGGTNDDCLVNGSTGNPSPIQRIQLDILDAQTEASGLPRFLISFSTGFSTSHLCEGDSGGPILTTQPGEINDPNNDEFGKNNVVAGQLLSVYTGGGASGEYGPVLPDQLRSWLVTMALDYDQDGVEAAYDTCDTTANPLQGTVDSDSDGWPNDCEVDDDNDGILDGEDICPNHFDPDQTDSDGDGFGDACDGDDDNDQVLDILDNCPTVQNPDQANCNALAEIWPSWLPLGSDLSLSLGDACDPVPCATSRLETETFVVHKTVGPYLLGGLASCTDTYGRQVGDDLKLRPDVAQASPALASNDLELRFCYCPLADPVACEQAPYHCRLDPGEVDLPEVSHWSDPASTVTRWLRVDLRTEDEPPVTVQQPFAITYGPHPAPEVGYSWAYADDFQQWVSTDHRFTPIVNDPEDYGPGTDLVGVLWAHDPDSTGSEAHFTICRAPEGCPLADGFVYDVAPDRAVKSTYCNELPQFSPSPWWAYCAQCFEGIQMPGDDVSLPLPFVSLWPEAGQALLWLPESARPAGWPAMAAQDVSALVSGELIASIGDESSLWVGASEPLAVAGQAGVPRALAVTADGSGVAAFLTADGGGFGMEAVAGSAATSGAKARSTIEAGSPRSGFAAVWSLGEQTLFVLGGEDAWGRLAESWSYRLDGTLTTLDLDSEHAPRQAESAVWSAHDRRVWVVDGDGVGRLLRRLDPATGAGDTAWLPELDDAERVWLTALENGRVVAIAVRGESWEILALEWTGAGEVEVRGSRRGEGTVVAQPGVRAGKVSLALAEHGEDRVGIAPIAVPVADLFAGATEDPREASRAAAFDRLRAVSEEPVETRMATGFPRFVAGAFPVGGDSSIDTARRFFERYGDFYLQSSPDLALEVRAADATRVALYQTWRGLPVRGGEVVVFLTEGVVRATVGALLTDVELEEMPALSPAQALEAAHEYLGGTPEPRVPARRLVYDAALFDEALPSRPQLVWKLVFPTIEVLVDAHDGEVVAAAPLTHNALDLEVRDADYDTDPACFDFPISNLMADESMVTAPYQGDPEAAAIRDGLLGAYQYFLDEHGLDSMDGLGLPVHGFAHWDAGSPNGMWDPGCNQLLFHDLFAADDTTAHEYTHGVVTFGVHGGPDTLAQQGWALSEHFADVMAMMVDPDDWTFAEHLPGGAARDFSWPPNQGDPAHMNDYALAQGEPHSLAGIPNRAAYVLTVGDGPFQVTTQGREKVAQLYFDMMRVAPQNLTFNSLVDLLAAQASIYAASWPGPDSHGFTPSDVCSVRRAFLSVGVGNGCAGDLPPESDGDGIPPGVDNCPLIYNPTQADCDSDDIGDACDPDDDNDGLADPWDPCRCNDDPWCSVFPGSPDDLDDDGIANAADNCPGTWNPDQANMDAALEGSQPEGDACDLDLDGDLVSDNNDNCLWIPNADQANADGDALGDVCDACPNTYQGDIAIGSWIDPLDNEPIFYVITADSDGDGIPDACDTNTISELNGWPTAWGANEIQADSLTRSLVLRPGEEDTLHLPLAACDTDCLEALSGAPLELELEGDTAGLTGHLLDDRGHSLGTLKDLGRGLLRLTFEPRGGRRYQLALDLRALGGREVELSVRLTPGEPRLP